MSAQGINWKAREFWAVNQYQSRVTVGIALTDYARHHGERYLDQMWEERRRVEPRRNADRLASFNAEMRIR